MKITAILMIALGLVSSAFGELTGEARLLKEKRDAKIAEINQLYAQALDKLQKKALKEGNLAVANLIEKEIATATPDPFVETAPNLEGKWLVNGKMVRSFYKNEMIDHVGGRHPWIYKDRSIVIDWGNGLETLKFDPKDPDVLDGENSNAEKVVYRKIR